MTVEQFYSVINPSIGELVLVQFTERTDSFFDAKLLEYPYRGMMSYQDATKKRKIYNWSKVVPLNKDMVARIDEVDIKAKIVQISISHLDEEFEESLTLDEIQNKLMVRFNENKLLENLINSVAIVNQCDKKYIWTKLIYYIDELRQEYNEENDEITLWNYFVLNIDMLEEWCLKCDINSEIYNSIKDLYMKRFITKNKIVSKIGIISSNGTENMKKILNDIFKKIDYKYTLKYDGTPNYLFETYSEDSNKECHEKFIDDLKNNKELFIKVDYIGRDIK